MKNQDKRVIEFLTESGQNIKLIRQNNKYVILVSEPIKKIENKKIFESLNIDISLSQFYKTCNYFTSNLKLTEKKETIKEKKESNREWKQSIKDKKEKKTNKKLKEEDIAKGNKKKTLMNRFKDNSLEKD